LQDHLAAAATAAARTRLGALADGVPFRVPLCATDGGVSRAVGAGARAVNSSPVM